jgi:glutamate-1-semialdehyde 2,1-aminomutase
MYCLFFSEDPVTNFDQAIACEHETFKTIFHKMLDQGVYLPPSSYETCFISTAHTEKEMEQTLEVFERSI